MTSNERYSHFRNLARSLWNFGFHPIKELTDGANQLAFLRIVESLFQVIMLGPGPFYDDVELGFRFPLGPDSELKIKVVPLFPTAQIYVGDETERVGCYTYGVLVLDVGTDEVDFEFVSPFDWDTVGIRDFQYIKVRIVSWSEHKEFEGRLALVLPADVSLNVSPPHCGEKP